MTADEIIVKANPGALDPSDIRELVSSLQLLKPGDVYLEIGVSLGRSLSVARMATDPGVTVCGIDISAQDPLVPGTIFLQTTSQKASKDWKGNINILFVDGDHSYGGCKGDLECWAPKMVPGGIIYFHDFNSSNTGVIRAAAEYVESVPYQEFKILQDQNGVWSMAKVVLN